MNLSMVPKCFLKKRFWNRKKYNKKREFKYNGNYNNK